MSFFFRNSRLNPRPSNAESHHLVQPQNTYQRFKSSLSSLFCGSRHHDATPDVDITAPGSRPMVLDASNSSYNGLSHMPASIVNPTDIPQPPGRLYHESLNPTSMSFETRNPFPTIAAPVTAPVATQFQSAHDFNISGNVPFTNIGVNTGNLTTVNNYGGIHGLENLEKSVSFAALYNSSAQDPKRRCHPGTRKNVLKRLRDWIDHPNSTDRIFWLHGPAGAGKSAIAQTIAHGYKQGEVIATFFFYRSDGARSDGNRLFTTIAWQLAFSIPAVKYFIVRALDQTPHIPAQSIETQFEQLVAHPFQAAVSQLPQLAPVVIIDGVDECSDEELQRRFLTVIGNAVKECHIPLRFLICSRPEALIEETLDQFKDVTLRIDLATLDDANRDIEKYLVDQFSVIASKQGLDATWPGQEIIDEIVFKSSGNFILASTLIRFIGDEDYSAESQLDIVRKLKPRGTMSPFGLLDELYMEILKRQLDQDFLKTFLALLVSSSTINVKDLHKDYAILMNVSKKELHIKLRRMRSLLKFEPFIDVHHKSFLDFLQDSYRSSQHHVSKQSGLKRYFELVVDSVIRHVSMSIEQPDCHEACSTPTFEFFVTRYPLAIDLPIEYWQDALKPLQPLQEKLLKISKSQLCHVAHLMHNLMLLLVILQWRNFHPITTAHVLDMNEIGTEWTLATEARQTTPQKDLDNCLSVLLSYLPNTNSVLEVDAVIIDCMSSLFMFDNAEIVTKVRSVNDAQKMIDLIGSLTNNQSFRSRCGPDAARKAVHLASEIFSRVPLLPQSLLLNGPTAYPNYWPQRRIYDDLTLTCQTVFISRILDHNYVIPVSGIYKEGKGLRIAGGDMNEQTESVDRWLKRSSPSFIARIRVMLEVARTIRYLHSMGVAIDSDYLKSQYFIVDPDLRARIMFTGLFSRWLREDLIYYPEAYPHFMCESTINAFGKLFDTVCFASHNHDFPNHLVEEAKQLCEWCRRDDPESLPTIEDIVTKMETWDLSQTV